MKKEQIRLEITRGDSDLGDMGYIYLPGYPNPDVVTSGIIQKQMALHELIKNYQGPAIYLDFDKEEKLIGIEILT